MQKKLIAPGYMHRFACLGGDCEDTCCQKWDINLDKQHYEMLLNKVNTNPQDQALFDSNIRLHGSNHSSETNYAYIKLNDSGYCPFLNNNSLCQLHAHYGVEPLSSICAFFPRVLSEQDDMVEMTGALSCPEVVRLCLFSSNEDQVMRELDYDKLPRPEYPVSRKIESSTDSYLARFDDVRAQMIDIINDSNYSFEARLYFLANFSNRLASFYHQDCENSLRVDEEIKRIQNEDIKKQLDDYFFKFSNTEPIAIIVIQAILQLRIQHEGQDKLSKLAKQILESYRLSYEKSEDFDVYGDNVPPDQLALLFQQRWDQINAKYGVRLEECFTRYVLNCLQRAWFISLPDPFVFIHMLTIRVAILRFLITSHPDMLSLLEDDESVMTFDQKIVEIIYLYARSIDHNLAFLHVVFQALSEQQMMSFDYSMALIKV